MKTSNFPPKTEELFDEVENLLKLHVNNVRGYYNFESTEIEPSGFGGDENWVELDDSTNLFERARSCEDDECFEKVLAMCEAKHPDAEGVWIESGCDEFDYPETCCNCGAIVTAHHTDSFFEEMYEDYFEDEDLYDMPVNDTHIYFFLHSYTFRELPEEEKVTLLTFLHTQLTARS